MQLYLYSMSDAASGEEFLKIGVSKDASKRFSWGSTSVKNSSLPLAEKVKRMMAGQEYIADHPYVSALLHVEDFEAAGFAWAAEAELLDVLKEIKATYQPQKPFPGQTECFRCDDEVKAMIVEWMTAQAAAAPQGTLLLHYKLAETQVRDPNPLSKHRKVLRRLVSERRWS